jgi:hypothetical protein
MMRQNEQWPRPVLADFGKAFYEMNTGNDPRYWDNPKQYVFQQDTGGYYAPVWFSFPSLLFLFMFPAFYLTESLGTSPLR